jgi:hypothetical protein
MMIKIFLTIDPDTGRALYDNESRLLGKFFSVAEAETTLGDLLRFCSIRIEKEHALAADF